MASARSPFGPRAWSDLPMRDHAIQRCAGLMIDIEHLTKRFGNNVALDDVSFVVEPGQIVGFLGPNGAGKSTCLRTLLGLVRADSGSATVAGHRYTDLPNPAMTLGSLLTVESFHPSRTGYEQLRLAALTIGLPMSRIAQVLDEVGLTQKEGQRLVGRYSLGMRQRLGLGMALLTDPPVLVLDEPANGLDPQGQRWLSDLLRDRAARGCAVLLSSHQLHEVSQVADRVVMIGAGRVLADQTLQSMTGDELAQQYFTLTSGVDRAA